MANEINEGIDIFAGIDDLDVENEVASIVEETPKADLFDESEEELNTKIQEEPQPEKKQEIKTEEKQDEVPKSKVKGSAFNSIVDFVINPIQDDEWNKFKEEMTVKVDGIIIKDNIPPNVVLLIASDLDSTYNMIYEKYMEIKTALDNFTNKEDGILSVIKATHSKGSNETERKANGVAAAQKYKIGKTTVNLFELIAETRNRYNFLQGLIDQIKFKKDLLIIASSAIKVLNK